MVVRRVVVVSVVVEQSQDSIGFKWEGAEDGDSEVAPGRQPWQLALVYWDYAGAGASRGHRGLTQLIGGSPGWRVADSNVFEWLPTLPPIGAAASVSAILALMSFHGAFLNMSRSWWIGEGPAISKTVFVHQVDDRIRLALSFESYLVSSPELVVPIEIPHDDQFDGRTGAALYHLNRPAEFFARFEQVRREECGFNRAFVWLDETKDAGPFAQSTIFTPQYFGSLPGPTKGAGIYIRDGAFTNTTLHIGPGSAYKDFENYYMSRTSYPDFESCWEYSPRGYGHNGIGLIMADVMGSVGDPTFWIHHTYVDRVFRVWQNADISRRTTISGTVADGSPLTLNDMIYIGGLRPNVRVHDVLDTLNGVM